MASEFKFKNINIKNKKIFFVFLLTFCSIFIGKFLWSKINIPFPENISIKGEYFYKKHHQLNDILRFIIFITIPLFISIFFFWRLKIFNFKNIFLIIKKNKIKEKSNYTKKFLFFLTALIFIDLICIELYFGETDVFHEGQYLTGAFNTLYDKNFFSNSALYVGFFFEILSGHLTNTIFGNLNISGLRLFLQILNQLTMLCMVILIWNIAKYQKINNKRKEFFFIILSLVVIYLFKNSNFSSRDLPSILFLIFLINYIYSKKYIYLVLISGACVLSFLYSVDRAAFINFTLIFFLIFLVIQKKYKDIILLLITYIFFWFIIYLIFGQTEFSLFLNDTLKVYKQSGLIQGIPYPEPFSADKISPRGTKSLIIVLISSLAITFLILSKNRVNNSLKVFFFFLFLISLTSFNIALSRSDAPHIKSGESFSLFFLITFVIFLLLYKKNILNKFRLIDFFDRKKYLKTITVILIFFLISKTNINNILNIDRFKKYIFLDDLELINNKYKSLVIKLDDLIKDSNCIQIFTHDVILPYLLRKKTCTRYYMTITIGDFSDQTNYINELNKKKALYILTDGDHFLNYYYPVKEHFNLIYEYINNKYEKKQQLDTWILYKKK